MPAGAAHGAALRSPDDCSNDGSVCLAPAWLMWAGRIHCLNAMITCRGFVLVWLWF
jgi:hypothetical protein